MKLLLIALMLGFAVLTACSTSTPEAHECQKDVSLSGEMIVMVRGYTSQVGNVSMCCTKLYEDSTTCILMNKEEQ